MSAKKVILIVIGTIFGLILLGFLAILTIGFVNRSINGAKVDDNKITSAYFEITTPEGSKLTNESKTTNNIYVTVPTEYGEIRVNITRPTFQLGQTSDRGVVTSKKVTVDGTPATQKTVDYSNVIRGTSQKLLIRYRVAIDKIAQPSDDEYSQFEATAMSKRNLTNTEEKDVEQKAEALIASLVIK